MVKRWKWSCTYEMGDNFHWALVDPDNRDAGQGDGIDRVVNRKLQ